MNAQLLSCLRQLLMNGFNPELYVWAVILGLVGGVLVGCGQGLIGYILLGLVALLMLKDLIRVAILDMTSVKNRNIFVLLALMCVSFFLLRSGIAWETIEWVLPLISGIMLAAIAELIARGIVIFRYVLGIF